MVEYTSLNENTNYNNFVKWYTGLVISFNFTLIVIGMIFKTNFTIDLSLSYTCAVIMIFNFLLYSFYESYKKEILNINNEA